MNNEIIQTRDAADFPQADVGVPEGTPSVQADSGQEGNLFPLGGNETITNEGLPTNQTAPIETEAPVQAQEPVQTEVPLKEDPSRMQYWQSQADMAKNDNYKLQEEINYYKNTLGPIANVIEKNPQVLDNIESLNNGNPQVQQTGPAVPGNSLEPPAKPEKPHSYNEVDAYNDPESVSFKYRVSHDKWRDDMFSHMQNVENHRLEVQQQQMKQQQKMQMMNGAHTYAMSQHGFDANTATDFVRWAQNPNNITIDSLISLYKAKSAPTQSQVQAQSKANAMKIQQERLKVPRPTVVQSGQSAPPISEEDAFSNALLQNGRR